MKDKIFISHASADSEIVSLFVEHILRSGCGVQMDNIVYTSWEDTGVVNGEDIPSAIKDGINESAIFIMMVSENYRESEVCLNEMGAAWMDDSLIKKIIVLPGVGFDRIGWLMSLKKGTCIIDEQGLDALHDQICEVMSIRPKTPVWNTSRANFIKEVSKLDVKSHVSIIAESDEDDAMDYLDHRESFSTHTQAYTEILAELTGATNHYNERIGEEAGRLNLLQQNPATITPSRVRVIMEAIAKETDILSEVYESNTPLLQEHFGASVNSAIVLQQAGMGDEGVDQENRNAFLEMMNSMRETKKSLTEMRDSMDTVPDLDKTFRKSKRRLQNALNAMLRVIDYCIKKTNDFQEA